MTAPALLATLRARGVEVVAAGDRLRYRPADAVPEDLVAAMRACKAELLALLCASEPERLGSAGLRVRPGAYSHPWPERVPGLGARHVGAFEPCEDDGDGSWVRYGQVVLCLRCARRRVREVGA